MLLLFNNKSLRCYVLSCTCVSVLQGFKHSSKSASAVYVHQRQRMGSLKNERRDLLTTHTYSTMVSSEAKYVIDPLREENKVKKILKMLGFSEEDIQTHPRVLKFYSHSIDHRFKILEEIGIPREIIKIQDIIRYPRLSSTMQELTNNINVVKNVLSKTDMPAELYTSIPDISLPVNRLQTLAAQCYLSWKLDLPKEEIIRWYKTYTSLNCKSIRLMMQTFNFLINDVGFPKEKIQQNPFLLQGNPDTYRDFLECLPLLGGLPMEHIVKLYPRIFLIPINNLFKILNTLKEFNIPQSGVINQGDILTLSPDTVRKRLETLHADPYYNPFFHNPRICRLVTRFYKVANRSKLLNESKWRCQSLDILSAATKNFDSRFKMGADISRGTDIVHYLHKVMDLRRQEVRDILGQNPFWHFISLSTVTSTLQYLQSAGFHRTHILAALPVILYPKEEVQKWMKQLESEPEAECCRDSTGKLQQHLTLQLVLYYLERPYHFSGNGIWGNDAKVPELQ